MRIKLILQFATLLAMLLAGPTEEFFFEYPKKVLMEFLQHLKAKKQPPKTNNIHHVYYYPLPLTLGWMKAPDKQDLDKLYEDNLALLGWTAYRYKFTPNPSMIVSSDFQQLYDDTDSWVTEIAESDPNNVYATIDHSVKGILLQVPNNQQFVFRLLKKKKETAEI